MTGHLVEQYFCLAKYDPDSCGDATPSSIGRILPDYGKFALIAYQLCDMAQKNPPDWLTSGGILGFIAGKRCASWNRRY